MADKDLMKEIASKYANRRASVDTGADKFISSGSVIMDTVISNGKGVPMGKFIQLTSDSGLGKTTVVLHMCKAACAAGHRVGYIDVEGGVNDSQLGGIGLTKYLDDKFFLYKVSTFEEAEEVMDAILTDSRVVYVVIDSITALIPAQLLEKSIGEVLPGVKARFAGAFLEKYRAKIQMSESKPTVWIINQMRIKLNFRGMSTLSAAGGYSQKFYSDIRLNMRESKKLTKTVVTMEGKKSVQYGVENYLWADKNRFNSPFVEAVITVLFGRGVSNLLAYQRVLQSEGVCSMSGAGFWTISLPGKEPIKARGTDGLQKAIKEHLDEIKEFVNNSGGFKLMEQSGDE